MNAQIQISNRMAIQNLRILKQDYDLAYNAAVNGRVKGERPSERAMRLACLLETIASLEMGMRAIENSEATTRHPHTPPGGY